MRPPDEPEETGQVPAVPAVDEPAPAEPDTPTAVVRHSAIMSVGTALSRLTGFLRLAAMAYALGVTESRLADAYNVANTTPNIIYDLALGGIISSVFIPVFVERLEGEGRDEAWHTARTVLTFALLVLGTVMLAGILASSFIIRAYTFRATGPQAEAERALASFFLKWFMPQIVFYGIGAGVATGLLNAHRKFAWPMFAPILNNVVAIATFFTFALMHGRHATTNISGPERYVLAIGTTLGVFLMSIVLWPSLRRIGFRWRWTLDLKDPGFRKIVRLAGWAFVYVVVNQLGLLVVIVLAQSVQGGYTAYTSAFIFFQLPYAIFAVSIMTALLPSLASRWTDGDRDQFRALLSQGIRGTAFIVVPAAFGYIALSQPIIRLLLQHGVTQTRSTELIAHVLAVFSVGLFSFCSFQLLLRAFYGMQDTKTPALVNVASVAVNVVADIVLFRYLHVEGLALGHATAYTVGAILMVLILRRRMSGLQGRKMAPILAVIGVAGVATGAVALAVSHVMGNVVGTATFVPQVVQVGSAVVAGAATYIAICAAFRLPELNLMKVFVLKMVRR